MAAATVPGEADQRQESGTGLKKRTPADVNVQCTTGVKYSFYANIASHVFPLLQRILRSILKTKRQTKHFEKIANFKFCEI